MPLPIELVKAQLKVWEYKCVLIVGNPHWPYAYKTTETYTYEYAMLTPSQHKMKLVLTHHVDAHPIPYLHVEVATADKKSSYQKPDIMNKPILIGPILIELNLSLRNIKQTSLLNKGSESALACMTVRG